MCFSRAAARAPSTALCALLCYNWPYLFEMLSKLYERKQIIIIGQDLINAVSNCFFRECFQHNESIWGDACIRVETSASLQSGFERQNWVRRQITVCVTNMKSRFIILLFLIGDCCQLLFRWFVTTVSCRHEDYCAVYKTRKPGIAYHIDIRQSLRRSLK